MSEIFEIIEGSITWVDARDATIASQAAQIERLREMLTRWLDYEDIDRIMGGVEAYEKLVAETDAALQSKEPNQ
jgi:hypothetical protein